MEIIRLENGSLILHSDKAKEKLNAHMQSGSVWEYISSLIEQDVKTEGDSRKIIAAMDKRFSEFENKLGSIVVSGGTAAQVAASSPIDNVGNGSHSKKTEIPEIKVITTPPRRKGGKKSLLDKMRDMRGE